MIVAFCGHSSYVRAHGDEEKVFSILENKIGTAYCEFFLGEYGEFDSFAYSCAQKFKKTHTNCKLVYITPYNSINHLKNYSKYQKERFDLVIYPELEKIPPRYAISHRNKWIAEQADIIIAYITHKYGGAYATYLHAKRKNKQIFNIAHLELVTQK